MGIKYLRQYFCLPYLPETQSPQQDPPLISYVIIHAQKALGREVVVRIQIVKSCWPSTQAVVMDSDVLLLL